jgi:hypothetical protein
LTGRIFDDRGNRMSPSHNRKGCCATPLLRLLSPHPGTTADGGIRSPRPRGQSRGRHCRYGARIEPDAPADDAELITTCVQWIEVRRSEIAISLAGKDDAGDTVNPTILTLPWSKTTHRRHRDVIVPEGASTAEDLRPSELQSRQRRRRIRRT